MFSAKQIARVMPGHRVEIAAPELTDDEEVGSTELAANVFRASGDELAKRVGKTKPGNA